MILLIDNYDSFSYNLYQFIGTINTDIKVIRNDELSVDKIDSLKPTHIVISPGPGKPIDAGVCEEVIKNLGDRYPILGVCLGHQAICEVYGATVDHASKLMHGKMSIAHIDTESKLFKGLDQDIEVARYHSLAAVKETLPDCLKITAVTDDNEIMAVEHKEYNVYGVQFHPESILTPDGMTIIRNFLAI
ncbi:MAG: aminodeoxychorismate/anthranilate synthase component II [Lachnospiraceae bacterium]|nr:aminodeoxychorismate/anthranilate synthase component II [Lachnospiraceae bacterium]